MKKRLWEIILIVLLLLPVCANATNITFTSSGSIVDGNVFDTVYVQNDGTVVNMSGGEIKNLCTYNSSTFDLSGGRISGVYISIDGLSTLNVYNGTINTSLDFVVRGSANFSGGNITAGILKTYLGSIVNITNGDLNFGTLDMGLGGELNIYGGLFNNVNDAYIGDESTITIFGYDFNYAPGEQGILTGYLLDNNPFIIKGISSSEYTRFNLIPEPTGLVLFGFVLLLVNKNNRGRKR